MTEQGDIRRKSRRDLLLVLLILPFGILCMFMTGQVAIKLAPQWVMSANMRSLLDPNATFVAQGVQPFIEPIDPAILTRPAWGELFLTPNAYIPTHLALTATPPPPPARTPPPPPVTVVPVSTQVPTSTSSGPIVIPTGGTTLRTDLRIEKSDNSATYTPGGSINYTIVVTNLGPDIAPSFNVTDSVPAAISGLSVNCTPVERCGTNNSSGNKVSYTGASLYAGGAITISVSGTVAAGKTGELVNTANVSIPSGVRARDPNSANNSATDTDTQLSVHDLVITKSDGAATTYTTTGAINYTIVVTNNGPSNATGIRVVDNKPAQIASWTWTCANVVNASGCNGTTNSTSNFNNTINIQNGGRIEYSVRAIPAGIPQNLSNTAMLIIPTDPTVSDPDLTNNTSTDTDIPYIDLSITKDDGVDTYTPGGTLTYTVTVTNNSTFNLAGVTISDLKPPQITTWQWCVGLACTGFLNTDISGTIPNLAAGSSLIYTVTANISATATGDLTNTATVYAPAGLTDAVPGNDSDFDIDTPMLIDLLITKSDGVLAYTPGTAVQYTIVVTNTSTIALSGVRVVDNIPTLIDPTTWTWSCGEPGTSPRVTCAVPSGTGNMDVLVDLPAGASVYLFAGGTVLSSAAGDLVNSATVYPPVGVPENTSNNTVEDRDVDTSGEPDIGPPDGNIYPIPFGGTVTFFLGQPIIANGDPTADFVFHEQRYNDPTLGFGIEMDQIIIEVSADGNAPWYQVLFWGDDQPDTNTNIDNVNLPNIASACPTEFDNCYITDDYLYPPGWGITIDVDNLPRPPQIPNGTLLYWIRFTEPGLSPGDGAHVDAIEILP